MPSQHGIHEDRSVGVETLATQESVREGFRSRNEAIHDTGILGKLKREGYRTYALTGNMWVHRFFGFPFEEVRLYDDLGEMSEGRWEPGGGGNRMAHLLWYLKSGSLPTIWRRLVLQRMANRAPRLFHWLACEKGTKFIIRDLANSKFAEPFLLFINMMEAHEPYALGEKSPCKQLAYSMITGANPSVHPDWRARYRSHSEIPVQGALSVARALKQYLSRSVMLVTSDHGQLLGERGRFGHGFTLDDSVLRVPLYARYPEGMRPLRQSGRFLSLSMVPTIVDAVVNGTRPSLGSDTAFGESFGPIWSLRNLARNDKEVELLDGAYAHRVRLYSGSGSATYNKSRDVVEELTGRATERETRASIQRLFP